MSFTTGLKALFSAPEIIKHGAAAADKLVFTAEEKAETQLKKIEIMSKYMESSTPSAISRRILVAVISFVWASCCVIWVSLTLLGAHDTAASIEKFMIDVVSTPFSVACTFYFLSRMVDFKKK